MMMSSIGRIGLTQHRNLATTAKLLKVVQNGRVNVMPDISLVTVSLPDKTKVSHANFAVQETVFANK